jgi:hypothetical protein
MYLDILLTTTMAASFYGALFPNGSYIKSIENSGIEFCIDSDQVKCVIT